MSILYRIFISERKTFLLFSFGVLAYGLFLLNKYLTIREYSHFWWECWLLSIAFLVIAFSRISPSSFLLIHKKTAEFLKEFFHLHFQKIGYLVAFLLIIASGIFFRLFRLDSLPWGLEGLQQDTAAVSEYAFRILEGIPYTPIGGSLFGLHDTLPYYYIALFFSLFGTKLIILRCAALSIGIINVVLTYFVIKSITKNIIVSLAGMALLSFSAVDTVLNYSALECVWSTPIHLSCFLLLSLAIKSNRNIHFLVAGLCFGLLLSTSKYFLALAPCIILMFIHHIVFNLQNLKSSVKGLALFLFAMFYVISPKLIHLMYYHADYFGRVWLVTNLDTLFNEDRIINAANPFLFEAKSTFKLLFFKDIDKYFIGKTTIIDQFVLPLFIIGIICAIVKVKNCKYFFLLCYLAFTIILNAATWAADYRCIIFMPLPYIMASLALNLTNFIPKYKKLFYVPVSVYLLLIILFNIKIYYTGMTINPESFHYRLKNAILGEYLKENPPDKKTYVSLGCAGTEMVFFNFRNKQMVDFGKLTSGVPCRWDGDPCNEKVYYKILSNIRKIVGGHNRRKEDLLLIFDDAPCHEEVLSRLESVFKRSRSLLPIYSKSCKRELVYATFELEKDEFALVKKSLILPYDKKIFMSLKEEPEVDKEIGFDWGLHPSLPVNNFSVQWDDFIKIDRDGDH